MKNAEVQIDALSIWYPFSIKHCLL